MTPLQQFLMLNLAWWAACFLLDWALCPRPLGGWR